VATKKKAQGATAAARAKALTAGKKARAKVVEAFAPCRSMADVVTVADGAEADPSTLAMVIDRVISETMPARSSKVPPSAA